MGIFTKQFADADKYEEWLQDVEGRINVLSVNNSPALYGATTLPPAGPVTITYQTDDRSLAPPRSMTSRIVEAAIIGVIFFATSLYVISKL